MDLSVLIATRNRGALLRETLAAMTALDAGDLSWELIVADNGSADETPAVLAEMAAKLPLVSLHEPRAGKNVALNRALEVARGELLVFTDDDVVPVPTWLQAHARGAKDWPDAQVFAGRIVPRFPEEASERVRHHAPIRELLCEFDLAQQEGPTDALPLGPNFSVRAGAMQGIRYEEEIGPRQGRDFAMGSETELLKRLRDRGDRIVYLPAASVDHVVQPHQIEAEWLLGRSFRMGRGLTRMGFIYSAPARRILGVPAYMWPILARTQMRHWLGRFLGWPRSFDIACEYQRLRGALHEHRLIAREGGGPGATPS